MIKRMSEFLAEKMVSLDKINNEEVEMYAYSFEIAIATSLNLLVSMLISLFFMKPLEIFLFVLGFVPIRMLKGGFHAKNHFLCTSILVMVELALVLIINGNIYDIVIFAFLGLSMILLFLRTQDSNPLLSKVKENKMNLASKIIIICIIAVAILFPMNTYCFSLVYGVGISSISVILRVVQKKSER